jgi:hypothetical protein
MDDERSALAFLCANLGDLRASAERGSWSDLLDMYVDEVRDGGSALAACRDLDLLSPDETLRTDVRVAGLPPVRLIGDYRCPRNNRQKRCTRRADRDPNGRRPLCALADEPMVFETRP